MGLLRSARGLNISSLTSQIKRESWNFVAHCGCYPSVATSEITNVSSSYRISRVLVSGYFGNRGFMEMPLRTARKYS
jgi:hypothetical protein